jgi:plastocyanin
MARTMRRMKGARALASGMLVLALSCAIPAISAAQDAATTTTATTTTVATTTAPESATPPADPADGSGSESGSRGNGKPAGQDGGGVAQPQAPAPASSQPTTTVAAPSKKARASASATVTMGDLFFSPSSVTVAVGDTVTWHNTGQAPHNATADDGSFKTQDLNNGQSASHTFTQAGTFSYICTIHPNMKGTVRVLASGSAGSGGGGGGASSSSSGSAGSEASAVTSPDAAGTSSTLPMTGMAVGGLALVGLGLLALGLIARQADRERFRLRWFSIF